MGHSLNWEPLLETAALTRRKLKIICVGAGYSGLTLAHKIQHECNLESVIDLQIYEKIMQTLEALGTKIRILVLLGGLPTYLS